MKKRLFCFVCLCLFLGGCEKTPTVDKPDHLTHVYTEEAFLLPEGYEYVEPVSLEGEYILRCQRRVQEGEAFLLAVSQWQVFTDGTAPVQIWEKTEETPLYSCVTADASYDLYQTWGESGAVYTLKRTGADGSLDVAENLTSLQGGNITGFHVDDQGYVYLFDHNGIQFLTPTLDTHGSLTGVSINHFVASGNRVVIDGSRGMEGLLAEVSAAEKDITSTLPKPLHVRSWLMDGIGALYYMTGDGLYRYGTDETGNVAGELLMDYVNSNLAELSYAHTKLLSDGRIFLEYYETDDSGRSLPKPVLMTPSPDIALSDVTVLELYSSDVNAASHLPGAVVRFNKAHVGETRIVWQDYSRYSTQEDPYAGETKLAMELEAGLISPDIFFGSVGSDTFRLLRKHDNLTDLLSLMETEPVYHGDNLFGCVKNTYTENDKLIALPLYVEENSAYGSAAFLEGDSWTIAEMLDIAQNLPADTVMKNRLSKQTAMYGLLGSHWPGLFIDRENGTCDFDSEDFINLLTYIDTLPENPEPLSDNAIYLFDQGKIVMASKTATSGEGLAAILQDKLYGENRILAGYPTRNGLSGTTLSSYGDIFAITETCAAPSAAWAFVKNGILSRYEGRALELCTPIWKSEYDKAVALCQENHYFATYEGYITSRASTIKLDEDGTYRGQTGKLVEMTQTDAEMYKNWLDTVGRPLSQTLTPTEVSTIITEELNRFYEGASTPTDCAGAIQSRVKLWLDENK